MDCENCETPDEEKPMIFKGERWCSENCRKALARAEQLELAW